MQVDIIDSGSDGASSYHARFFAVDFVFDSEKRTLKIYEIGYPEPWEYSTVKINDITLNSITLEGLEPLGSGTGLVPASRKIILRLQS